MNHPAKPTSFKANLPAVLFGAVLVGLFAFGYFNYRSATATDRLFYDYFSATPTTDIQGTRALSFPPAAAPTRQAALDYQLAGEYSFAFEAWRAHFDQYGESDQVGLLYAAANAMAFGHHEQAAWYLNKIKKPQTAALAQEVNWYQALRFLRTNEVARSKAMLAEIDPKAAPAKIRRQLPNLLDQLAAY